MVRLEEQAYRRQTLQKAHSDSLCLLDELRNRSLADRLTEAAPIFRNVLNRISEAVFSLVWRSSYSSELQSVEGHQVDEPCDVYFWPGYESISLPAEARRVSWSSQYKDEAIPSGRGFCGKSECPVCDKTALTAVAFSKILTAHKGDIVKGEPFYPGSTHLWAAQSKPVLKRDNSALEILCVRVGTSTKIDTDHSGYLELELNSSTPESWGPDMAVLLKEAASSEPAWPYGTNNHPKHVSVQRSLYSLWLAATLDNRPSDPSSLTNLSKEIVSEDRLGLEYLFDRLAEVVPALSEPPKANVRRDRFRFWYTICLSPTTDIPSIPGSDSLGSAMILSTKPLDLDVLFSLRAWIENIYLNMRAFEGSILSERFGSDAQAFSFAHEMKHLSSALNNNWVRKASELLEVNRVPRDALLDPKKIGRLSLIDDPAYEDLRILPLPDAVLTAGEMIRFWSALDLKYWGFSDPCDLSEIASECLRRAREGAIFHGHLLMGSSVGSASLIQSTFVCSDLLRRVFFRQKYCWDPSNPPLEISPGSGTAPVIARIFVAIFKNCLQHGDPFSPIKVWCWPENGHFRIKCSNSVSKWVGEKCPEELLTDHGFSKTEAQILSLALPKALAPGKIDSKSFSSRNVVELSAQRLGGTLIDMGTNVDGSVYSIEFTADLTSEEFT